MRSSVFSKTTVFILGGVVASAFFLSLGRHWKNAVVEAQAGECERKINISIGRDIVNRLPILNKIAQCIESNQVPEEQRMLCEHMWLQLESAWSINKQYNGVLEEELRPLLVDIYPRLRQQVNTGRFGIFPKTMLVEMSNFVAEADAMVRAEHKTNEVGSATN